VQCCHAHYLGHYDIKPENFMYSDHDCKALKMIDLGLSGPFKNDSKEFRGSVAYTAPEVWNGVYGPEADIWSCGVILFSMVTQRSLCPMDAADEEVQELVESRLWIKKKLDWASYTDVSPECMDLLGKMLRSDRHMRITAAEALNHPFIQKTYTRTIWNGSQEREEARTVIGSMVDRLVQFGAEPVLVRAALLVMVHIAGYSHKETKAHRFAYSILDRNGVGELSIESIEDAMPKLGFAIPPNLDEAFKGVDLDRDGYITYGDFLTATMPLSLRRREDLCRRAFRLFDHNKDGLIDEEDLAATFLGQEERDKESLLNLCRQAITEVSDSNEFGPEKLSIDFEQFFRIILNGHKAIFAPPSGYEALHLSASKKSSV